jgi:DNA-nicking Smr family endonuclease
VINLPEYMEGYVDGTSPLVIEKLRNGEFSIQKVLDLHGLSAHDACDVFHAFLGEAVQSGFRCVRIIHGRGLKSRRGPVLKEKLKEWIVRAMHRKWVVAFASCRMADGGPGATTILLRAHAHKKKLHIIG